MPPPAESPCVSDQAKKQEDKKSKIISIRISHEDYNC